VAIDIRLALIIKKRGLSISSSSTAQKDRLPIPHFCSALLMKWSRNTSNLLMTETEKHPKVKTKNSETLLFE
jgi:hypothetical protein